MRAAVPMAVIPLAAYGRSRLDRTVGIPPLIFEPRWQAGGSTVSARNGRPDGFSR